MSQRCPIIPVSDFGLTFGLVQSTFTLEESISTWASESVSVRHFFVGLSRPWQSCWCFNEPFLSVLWVFVTLEPLESR